MNYEANILLNVRELEAVEKLRVYEGRSSWIRRLIHHVIETKAIANEKPDRSHGHERNNRVTVGLSVRDADALDRARKGEPRSSWVRRAIQYGISTGFKWERDRHRWSYSKQARL